MKTYADIKAEIAKLEARAEKARKAEIAGVVERIKGAIAAYGLTARDLGLEGGKSIARAAGKQSAGKVKATVGVAKYRDPETGKTWTGRGKPPNWIAAAKDRTPFLIDESASAKGSRRPDGRKARKATLAGDALSPGRSTGAGRKARAPAKSPAVQIEPPTAQ